MLPTATVTTFPYHLEDTSQDERIGFAVVAARYQGKWVLCRHRERQTWECPGGHREQGETPLEAARRELFEETGAIGFTIKPVCVYRLGGLPQGKSSSDGLIAYAEITEFGEKPESEIAEYQLFDQIPAPEKMTYPTVHPLLMEIAEKAPIKLHAR